MKKSIFFIATMLFTLQCSAQQNVRVSGKPSAVFTPTAGGYILRQPGPSLNLSLTPQPVTPPSSGIKGTGSFSGGKKFRVSPVSGDFEMGGTYDMPIPKTNQKVPVTAISKVPSVAIAKSALKALPIVGNALLVGELMQQISDEWDSIDPPTNGPNTIDPQKGEIFRQEQACICPAGGTACGVDPIGSTPPEGMCYVGTVSIIVSWDTAPQPRMALGFPVLVKTPLNPLAIDSLASKLSPQDVGELLDHVQSSPKAEQVPFDLPSDLPTEVTGPSEVPTSTTTKQNADGTTTTTETKTQLGYDQSKITVQQTTVTTKTGPNGEPITSETETTSGETPAPIPGGDPSLTPTPDDGTGTGTGTGGAPTGPFDVDICKLNPDILACKKLDSATEEIPKETKNITLEDGPTFSGGSCIPPLTVQVFGNSVQVINFATPCTWLTDYVKPLFILMAAISAVFIVMPRES